MVEPEVAEDIDRTLGVARAGVERLIADLRLLAFTLALCSSSSRNARSHGFPEACCICAAVSRKLRLGRYARIQPFDGPRLASDGRRHEKGRGDLPRARAGDLIDRMPSGMLQIVGENGWQLSHGERSRLYIARALLQGADLLMLDESFAALDPETMRLSFRAVLERAKTVLIIAHR